MNKTCTDLTQSKKLIELGIDVKTADMYYFKHSLENYYSPIPLIGNYSVIHDQIPCWSLAALIAVLPLETETHKQIPDGYKVYYYVESYMKRMGKEIYLSTERHDNLIDACYEMIIKLHEQNLL